MKHIRKAILLAGLLILLVAVFSSCNQDSEENEPYQFTFVSNNDGTCYISHVEFNPDYEGECSTLVFPDHSPDGDVVTGIKYQTCSPVPRLIAQEDFEEHILKPLLAHYDGDSNNFFYKWFLSYYGGENGVKDLDQCATDRLKEDMLEAFPMVEYTPIYVFNPTASVSEIIKVSALLSEIGYSSIDAMRDDDHLKEIANGQGYYEEDAVGYPSTITSIVFPDSLTMLDTRIFSYCSSLESVVLPPCTIAIADGSFAGCINLANISISDGVTSIGEDAFSNCYALTSIVIPDSVEYIGYSAFENCNSLISVDMPSELTFIGKGAFICCNNLTSITLPFAKVPEMSDDFEKPWLYVSKIKDIFHSDSYSYNPDRIPTYDVLKEIVITGGDSIEDEAFAGFSSLTSISIPDSITSIGSSAFSGCNSLTSITIPDSVTSIGDYAFSGCASLTSITIPDSVTSVGDYAFQRCTSLTSATIPDSVTGIGNNAFSECTSLVKINIPSSVTKIGIYAFSYCSSLTEIEIPASVTSIGNNAFVGCHGLTDVTIPSSVTFIGSSAFTECSKLTSITYTGTMEQWNAIQKGSCLKDLRTKTLTIHCLDGDVAEN